MGGQVVLTPRRFVAALLALVVSTLAARAMAQEQPENSLRRPHRLTAGVADQLLGQLAPDGKTLYFLSTRSTTHELFAEDLESGRSRRLFDDGADLTWPRVAPDGKSLLYLSFRDGVSQLCVRDLPSGNDRRCLIGAPAALQAEWVDHSRVVVVERPSLAGGLRVALVEVGPKLSERPMFERDLSTPAVSPDGRWIAYVPIERTTTSVGPSFAARASEHLEVVRFDHPETPVKLAIDLPGRTGQPTFSRDGRYLHFVQFFSDSNGDGIIDADDHGVLFRAPIDFASGVARLGEPEQLTDTGWNCQYPRPSATQLVATCTRDRQLDVYMLPLDGEVPRAWSLERVGVELDAVTRPVDQQLLHQHRLLRATTVTERQLAMASLVRLDVAQGEFDAAKFYADRIARITDTATAGIARPLAALVEHRRALRQRELGRLESTFSSEARVRSSGLREEAGDSRAATALVHVVRSEIADTLGDKTSARTELERALLSEPPAVVVRFLYERADALYRELDDRAALVAVCERLATNTEIGADERLEYARAATRAVTRGLPFDAADVELARERAKAPADSELAFAIDLERAVLAIRGAHPGAAARNAIVALYEAQTRPERRRAVVLDAVRHAAEMSADGVIDAIAVRHLADTAPGTLERKRAERLYERAIMGRAYRRAARGHTASAIADFDAVAAKSRSLESVVASIDLRVQQGNKPDAIAADYDAHAKLYTPDTLAFVRAYLISLELPSLEGHAFEAHAARARAALDKSADLKNQRMVPALNGSILHQEFLQKGDTALAMRANVFDLIALDLARNDPRMRAMLLGQLGVLHTSVGNYQIALSYLKRRDELPFVDDAASLATRMAEARAQLHAGHDAEAARIAEESLAMTERTPALAEYRVVALDRAALYALSAGRFDRALALYDRLVPLLLGNDDEASRRNRFVTRLARAAAAVGANKPARALEDLGAIEPALRDGSMRKALDWPHANVDDTMATYGAIVTGLRANAHGALHDLDAQGRALAENRARFAERYARSNQVELLRALGLVETRLAGNAAERGDATRARDWAATALTHADALRPSPSDPIQRAQVDALWLAAELSVFLHAPPAFDITTRLANTCAEIATGQNRRLARTARWLEVYEVLIRP